MSSSPGQSPTPLRRLRTDAPEDVDRIVSRALEKDVASRYQFASEMARDLSAALAKLSIPLPPPASRELQLSRTYAVTATLPIAFLAAAAVWLYQRSEKRRWAREEAIPAIARLESEDKSLAAFFLLKEAEQYLPGDPQLTKIAEEDTRVGYADAHRNLLLTLLAQGRTREAARSTPYSADRAHRMASGATP